VLHNAAVACLSLLPGIATAVVVAGRCRQVTALIAGFVGGVNCSLAART
jgi:hypothetical protein